MPITSPFALAATLCLSLAASTAFGQIENPVYVDDSPQAWELFRQARDQTKNNVGEAVRLYQELLDDFPLKLIPASDASTDHFMAVRQRVLAVLAAEPDLLDRYRVIQKPIAEQLLQADELETLAQSRSLTESGLEALLRLAQRDLEAGRFQTALNWLNEAKTHPDLVGRRAVHCAYMSALAADYLGKREQALAALPVLAELGAEGEACRKALEARLQNEAAPGNQAASAVASDAVNTLDVGQVSDLDGLVGEAIWSVPLEDALVRRRMAAAAEDQPLGVQNNTVIEQRLRDADFATAIPTVSGENVYINEGHTILSINRLTGHQNWKYSNLLSAGTADRDVIAALDVNVIAVEPGTSAESGGSIVTLTGHAQSAGRSEAGRVICLDAATGSLRWSLNFAQPPLIDAPANEQLFPHGTPVIADGTVFVAARRVSIQAMTSAYVVAIDLASGNVKWVRYICSSGGLRAGIRPFDTLVYSNQSSPPALFIASAVGATARLEPSTGEITWLCRFNAPINIGLADQARRPWEMGGPVMTPRGVLVIEPDQRRIALLDAETGTQLESHASNSTADWASPRYLLADEHRVYAIGSEIRAFDLEDLSNPIWRVPGVQKSNVTTKKQESKPSAAAPGIDLSSLELRGRVQLVDSALIAPTSEGVIVLDSQTGDLKNSLALQNVGNPLAVDAQLLLACGDRLDSYMSFDKAERMLRDRIAKAPAEPEPALSLLRLGMRVRNLPLALEAAELARRAMDRTASAASTMEGPERKPQDARSELLSLLLELASANVAGTPQEAESLYAAINAAAVEPAQRVDYLLAYGDWLGSNAGTSLERAVECYQSILSDRKLAESWRIDNGVMQPAAAYARKRLSDLLAVRPNAYAPQADFAALRLKQIAGAANAAAADPEQLQVLSQEYPFSDAAIDAALQAANIHLKRGNTRAALGALMQLYRAAPRQAAAERLLGKFVSICVQAGMANQVEAVMRHVRETYGDIALQTDLSPPSVGAWLSEKSQQAGARRLPVIGDQATAVQPVTGSLIEPYKSPASESTASVNLPADRALLRVGNTVRLVSSRNMEPLWTTTIPGESPQLLSINDQDIVLWLKSDPQDPKAVMLNAADGQIRWTSPRVADLLSDPVRDLNRARAIREQMPNGEPFDPMSTIPLVGTQSLFLIQGTGGVVAVDLKDGKTIRWVRKQTLEQIHAAVLHDNALVLAGMVREVGRNNDKTAGSSAGTLTPRLLVLDPNTGQPLFDENSAAQSLGRSPSGGVKWMRVLPMGQLICGTSQGLHALDLYTGRRLWTSANYALLDTQRAWAFNDRLVVEDQRSRLRSVDMRDGSVSEPFEIPLRGEWDPLELRQLMMAPGTGRLIAQYPQRVVIYDLNNGSVLGADVISDDRDYRWLLPAQERMVLINSRTTQAPVPDQPGRRAQQWVYRVFWLSENCKVVGQPVELPAINDRVQYAALIDGWLLLSTNSDTLAIPIAK